MHTATLILCLLPALTSPADEADDQYQFVAGLCEQGHHQLAVREARKFLEEYPRHAKATLARYRLASSLFELDRPGEAAPHFRRLAEGDGFEYAAESYLRLGQCELLQGRPAEALAALEQAYASEQAYLRPAAAFFLGEASFVQDQFARARVRYAEVLKAESATDYHAHARRSLAWCEFRLGSFDASATQAGTFLARHSEHELSGEMQFLLGDALLEGGHPEQADRAWQEIDSGEFHDAALRGRAFARSALDDPAGAAELFGALVKLAPEGRFAREAALQEGAHLLRAGKARRAVRALSAPVAGNDPEVLYWRGRAQAASGEAEAALVTFETAARSATGELAARISAARGDLLFELGRLEESAEAFGTAQTDYALHAGATAQLNAGNSREAVRLARALLERFPESPYAAPTRVALAEGLFAEEQYAEAREVFGEVSGEALDARSELAPEHRARCQARIAWCHYFLGDKDAAARAFRTVSERFPRSAESEEARYMEGRAALEADEPEGAVAAWTSYLAEHQGGEHHGEVLLQLSRLESSTAHLERLLAEAPGDELADQALFELAEKLSGAGESEAAIGRYLQLLKEHPRSDRVPAARYGLAWTLREIGRPAEAVKELDTLLRREPRPEPELALAARELQVWAAAEAGQLEPCLVAWRSFAGACRDEARLFATAQVAARALDAAGHGDEAQRLVAELLESLTDPAIATEALVEGVWLALDAGQVDRAEVGVVEALRISPADPEVLEAVFFVGEQRFAAGEHQKAAELYRIAAGEKGGKLVDDALYKLGFARLLLGAHAPAAQAFEELVAEHPGSELWGESLFLAGECRFRAGEFERAAEHLSRARAELPEHEVRPKALFRLGLACFELRRHSAASDALTELVKKHPEFEHRAEAELCRGRALAAEEKPRAARAAFDLVLAKGQGVLAARARIEIGLLHVAAGRHDDALSQFLKVALLYADGDEVAEATFLAGRCLEAQGEKELAAKQFRQLVLKYPDSRFAAAAKKRLQDLR